MSQVVKKPPMPDQLIVRREKGKIWSHIRKKWIVETPEETVRQEYLCIFVNEYGFSLDQIWLTFDFDPVHGHGGRSRTFLYADAHAE